MVVAAEVLCCTQLPHQYDMASANRDTHKPRAPLTCTLTRTPFTRHPQPTNQPTNNRLPARSHQRVPGHQQAVWPTQRAREQQELEREQAVGGVQSRGLAASAHQW